MTPSRVERLKSDIAIATIIILAALVHETVWVSEILAGAILFGISIGVLADIELWRWHS